MKSLFLLLLLWSGSCCCAQETADFSGKVLRNMVRYVARQPQEKIYLHTDKDHYSAGEKVWFRAYLVNAITHKPVNYNSYVYVELTDRQDSVWRRVKIAGRDSVYAGYMPLSEKLPQGDYYLRTYTYWMQNAGDDFIPRKKIRIVNPLDSKVLTSVHYEKAGDTDVARIRFVNSRNEVYGKVFVEYTQGGKLKIARTDEEGNIRIKLDSGSYRSPLLVRFKDENPFTFERYVHLVNPRKDFMVDFFPEGGHLLAGNLQTVAFKALGTNGLSCEVSGGIFDDRDEQVGWVQSLHKGMGGFELNVEPGKQYYAVLTSADSLQKRINLPVTTHYGMALKVLVNRDVLGYSVLAGDSTQIPEDLHILIHAGGVPLLCTPLPASRKGHLSLQKVPEGILHVVLIDSKEEVYSERLCFIAKEAPVVEMQTDKVSYSIRDLVNLQIKAVCNNMPAAGSFSIAVTDDSRCERDSMAGNIRSSLLLTADLKGYVEDPAFYFRDNRVTTRRFLDLLMLTQGWTRFNLPEIVFGKPAKPEFYMERGQAVSGRVKNIWGKEAMNANLILLSTNGIIRMMDADSSGHFMIDGIAFPDSTRFVVQGRNKKGRRNVEVVVDQDVFLRPSRHFPYDEKTLAGAESFYEKFRKDYYYDNGIKVYVLDEVVVKQKLQPKVYSFYDAMADYNLDSARLASMGDMDIRLVLQEIPGVDFWDDSVKRMGKNLYVLVNDLEEDMDYIRLLQPRDLVSISLLRPPLSTTLFGEVAANGALIITTNPHFIPREVPRLNMAQFSALGYQKKAEFYMPHYEVDSIRQAWADSLDQRTTIYWNPDIRTDTVKGASCFFTTSDSNGPYTIIIEGILQDGRVCRREEKVFLKSR